jgi:DnaJ domain
LDVSTRTWFATDYYELLGVDEAASHDEIVRAFRASAKDHHPDRADDASSGERFKALSSAYGVLGNPERRGRYDELRAASRVEIRSAAPPSPPVPEANRPLSVRAFPARKHGRWASIGGIVLVVAGVAASGLVIWLFTSGSTRTANGSDATGRNITLALVALKLVVVGVVFVVLGNRRRRYP